MRLIRWETLLDRPDARFEPYRERLFTDIRLAVEAVIWPPGSADSIIRPESGKERGKGNGVKPIKKAFINRLEVRGWIPEKDFPRVSPEFRPPGPFDSFFTVPEAPPFVAEWETGNVSSSHRAVNKIVLGIQDGGLTGGVLVVPTRHLARYLTDRIGNYEELEPYFRLWSRSCDRGYLAIIGVEHDNESTEVPRIAKGTDGRALL